MRDDQDVEKVADNKTPEVPPASATPARSAATTPLEPSTPDVVAPATPAPKPSPPMPSVLSNDHSLGQIMAMARERRGGSRDQAAIDSNIPGYYLTMIESDDYSSIADQLYLLPFLRRYATFVRLDPEEVASRFIRDVQRADMNATRMSEPIAMIDHTKHFPWVEAVIGGVAVLILGLLIWLAYYLFFGAKSTAPAPAVPRAAQVLPQAPSSAPAAAVPPPIAIAPAPKSAALPAPNAPRLPASNAARPNAPAPRPHAPAAKSDLR
jgi:cytoskeletal protein RodZ